MTGELSGSCGSGGGVKAADSGKPGVVIADAAVAGAGGKAPSRFSADGVSDPLGEAASGSAVAGAIVDSSGAGATAVNPPTDEAFGLALPTTGVAGVGKVGINGKTQTVAASAEALVKSGCGVLAVPPSTGLTTSAGGGVTGITSTVALASD